MTAAVTLRPARAGDAEAVCLIYNHGLEDRVATLETELRSPEERREWMAARGPRHPVIVAESGGAPSAAGTVVGWGSLNLFNARPAYRQVADFSVYVERALRGKGVGHRLLERLIEIAREIGDHKMALSTFPTNADGVRLYERLGFSRFGVYHEQGMLDGQWVDTLIMEKLL